MKLQYEKPNFRGQWVEIPVYSGALLQWVKFKIHMDGEWIRTLHATYGLTSKGIESIYPKSDWGMGVALSGRIESENSIPYEEAYSSAIEKIVGTPIPIRGRQVRFLVRNLGLITSYLRYFSLLLRSLDLNTFAVYPQRERELALDIFELLTGSRFNHEFVCIGGVKADITEGVVERLLKFSGDMTKRLVEYKRIFLFHPLFEKRLKGLGWIADESHQEFGWGKFAKFYTGDSLERARFRFIQMEEAIQNVSRECKNLKDGPFRNGDNYQNIFVPQGDGFSTVMGARGPISAFVFSNSGVSPLAVRWSTPSLVLLAMGVKAVNGSTLEEARWIFRSLDISVTELDR